MLNLYDYEVIYTSGASESNNTAIKGICNKYQNRGKKIITTNLEHSSVYGPVGSLQNNGFDVEIVNTNEFGIVDLNHLESLMDDEVILVTIASVNSETGILQPINEIGKIISKHPKTYFHVDLTQSIGKVDVAFDYVDCISISAHKIYGLKGIGALIKRKNLVIEPLIHGGKSTTKYRSGTPATSLIVSLSKALRLSIESLKEHYKIVEEHHYQLIKELSKYEGVTINSNNYSIPHIINFSVIGIKPETMQHALEEYEVYISTQSACSSGNPVSRAVLEVTKNEDASKYSLRISLSYLTTKEELQEFLQAFDKCYQKLYKLRS